MINAKEITFEDFDFKKQFNLNICFSNVKNGTKIIIKSK